MPTSEAPNRLTLTYFKNPGRSIEVQFNPNILNRSINVAYAKRKVLGLSHRPHEYLGTENQKISFALFYNVETADDLLASKEALLFLESLAYGPDAPSGITPAAPSRVVITWPNTLTIIGRMISVAFKHERFNRFGDTIQWSAACVFEAASVRRITNNEFDLPRTDVVNDDFVAPIELF